MLRIALLTIAAGVAIHAGASSTPSRPASNFDVDAPLWQSGTYTYDGAGNILTIGDDTYDYDLAGRVIAGTAHTKTHANSQTFDYDVYGNLKTVLTRSGLHPATNAPWVASLLTIDSATNRILKPCGPAAGCADLVYDPAGNVTSDDSATYSWDLLGNMQQLTAAGRNERYLYDASNERIATITVVNAIGNPTHEFRRYTIRGANQKVLREATDEVTGSTHSWKWNKDYVHRDGSLLASIAPVDAAATTEETNHFHLDHLGTARVTTDANGYRRSMNAYYPFGTEAPGSDFNRERMRFTGHERDFADTPANDLDYMHARYYRAAWGRFLSIDPGRDWDLDQPQSGNLYNYARNNPVLNTDPDGKVCGPCIAAGALIGATVGVVVEGVNQTLNVVVDGKPVDNRAFLRAGVAGAISGGMAGACGTCAFTKTVVVGAVAGVVGGAAGRQVDMDPTTKALDSRQMKRDALAGAVGSAVGYGVAKAMTPAVAKARLGVSTEQAYAQQNGLGLGAADIKIAQQELVVKERAQIALGTAASETSSQAASIRFSAEDEEQRKSKNQ